MSNNTKKIIIIIAVLFIIKAQTVIADTIDTPPMPIMPRVGIQNKVEDQNTQSVNNKESAYIQDIENPVVNNTASPNVSNTSEVKVNNEVKNPNGEITTLKTPEIRPSSIEKPISYSDIDMKKIALEIKEDLKDENAENLADLSLLWQAAAGKSQTIRFAILKLSNPDGDQEKKSIVKTILAPLTSVAPLVGMGSGSAAAGGGTLLGSGLLGSMLADDSLLNKQLSRVTDSDLVILAQQIDTLQQKLVDLYYNYVSSVKALNYTDKIVANRYKYYQATQNSSKEALTLADVFYRESLDMQYKARQEALSNRASLEQFVGNDALIQVDKKIRERLAEK